MKVNSWPICVIVASVLLSGCFVTEEYSSYSALQKEGPSHLRVMTRDTVLYTLSTFTVADTALQGAGTRTIHGLAENFSGNIPKSEIVYMQGREFSLFRTLVAGFALGTTAMFISGAGETDGMRIYESGGSCPYAYAWDGDVYRIQGETFGTAFGKALETSTSCMLPAAAVHEGTILLRLSNERPETHYVNSVHLFACQAPPGSNVMLDIHQQPWAVRSPLNPISPPAGLEKKDGRYWKSDLRSTFGDGGYRDTVELTFPMPERAAGGSLIAHAINTELINAVYQVVFQYLGEQVLPFLYEVENNRELITRLREWITECSLTVEIWKDGQWVSSGMILPEANYVPFSKIVRIEPAGVKDKEIRVRLTTLADVWQIDAVEADWTASAPLDFSEQTMISASHSVTGQNSSALLNEDNIYSVMFPGERIDMAFSPRPVSAEGEVFYFLKARGYLYESLPEAPGSVLPALWAPFDRNRVQTVCNLVKHRDALLELVYDHWREMRQPIIH